MRDLTNPSKFSSTLGEKDSRILNSFVERNFMEIRNTALGGERELGDFRKAIIDAFMVAINSIDRDCYSDPKAVVCRYDDFPPDYRSCYADESTRLTMKTMCLWHWIRIL